MFTAYHRDEWLFGAGNLDAVLAFVRACLGPAAPEDAVVYSAGRVVAVCLSDGRVLRLDGAPPAPPAPPEVPADLARQDEASA